MYHIFTMQQIITQNVAYIYDVEYINFVAYTHDVSYTFHCCLSNGPQKTSIAEANPFSWQWEKIFLLGIENDNINKSYFTSKVLYYV